MIKKVLFISFLFLSTLVFSQKTIEKVYAAPNPFATNTKIYVNLKSKQTIYFKVKNILGRTVYSKKLTLKKGKNSIPFSKDKLRSGMYIYSIQNKKESISKRLVIK